MVTKILLHSQSQTENEVGTCAIIPVRNTGKGISRSRKMSFRQFAMAPISRHFVWNIGEAVFANLLYEGLYDV